MFGRIACLFRCHDPQPLAAVIHIRAGVPRNALAQRRKIICRRCGTSLA
jgi:hypothetical protein